MSNWEETLEKTRKTWKGYVLASLGTLWNPSEEMEEEGIERDI